MPVAGNLLQQTKRADTMLVLPALPDLSQVNMAEVQSISRFLYLF